MTSVSCLQRLGAGRWSALVLALLLGLTAAIAPPAALANPATRALGPGPDLEQAAAVVEAATEDIRQGLKQTQRQIGKTDTRSAAIEQGRDRAVAKLKGLLERVEAAETLEALSETDQLTLKRLTP
ncbi:MAG: hypothetical protein AAF289_16590 [Cyanobacteria bacterium P01_A01_bin.135]